ncbi:MAG: sulfite exporter TauE/SafE family protein [Candidatus Omnitrophica bacterium]|jgi:hypothetical protein|nr:sulfite exporter TauE/SafE family protein [Candidatus Omnitrophota bacterium]
MKPLLFLVLGLLAGIFGGAFGIGGASVMVPALVYFFGFTQHQAQGTILAAMVPPIGLLAALRYWQAGNVNIPVAALLCAGFFLGGYFGAGLVQGIPDLVLKKAFGVFLLIIAVNMILGK